MSVRCSSGFGLQHQGGFRQELVHVAAAAASGPDDDNVGLKAEVISGF